MERYKIDIYKEKQKFSNTEKKSMQSMITGLQLELAQNQLFGTYIMHLDASKAAVQCIKYDLPYDVLFLDKYKNSQNTAQVYPTIIRSLYIPNKSPLLKKNIINDGKKYIKNKKNLLKKFVFKSTDIIINEDLLQIIQSNLEPIFKEYEQDILNYKIERLQGQQDSTEVSKNDNLLPIEEYLIGIKFQEKYHLPKEKNLHVTNLHKDTEFLALADEEDKQILNILNMKENNPIQYIEEIIPDIFTYIPEEEHTKVCNESKSKLSSELKKEFDDIYAKQLSAIKTEKLLKTGGMMTASVAICTTIGYCASQCNKTKKEKEEQKKKDQEALELVSQSLELVSQYIKKEDKKPKKKQITQNTKKKKNKKKKKKKKKNKKKKSMMKLSIPC